MKMMWCKRNGTRKIGQKEFAKSLVDLPMFQVAHVSQIAPDYLAAFKALSASQIGDRVLYSTVA